MHAVSSLAYPPDRIRAVAVAGLIAVVAISVLLGFVVVVLLGAQGPVPIDGQLVGPFRWQSDSAAA